MGAIAPIGEGYFDASATDLHQEARAVVDDSVRQRIFHDHGDESFRRRAGFDCPAGVLRPLLIAAGGNSGSQSSTLVIRALAVGQIQTKDWWRVLLREVAQGLVLGAMLAVFGVARVLFAGDGTEFAFVIALTIMGIVLMGCVVGGMMPIILHRFGIDPATSSTPFIATLVDVLGIVIYLGLAQLLLVGASAALGGPK